MPSYQTPSDHALSSNRCPSFSLVGRRTQWFCAKLIGLVGLVFLTSLASAQGSNSSAVPPRQIPSVLTLNRAIALAVERNPELRALASDTDGARARIRQARVWQNPQIEFEYENFGGTGRFSGSAAAETTLSIAKSLPLGGDISQRRVLAELELQRTDWDYHAQRLKTVLEVTERFVAALVSERRLELVQRELELAEATKRLTETRVETGDASPAQLTRLVVPIVTAELNVARAERTRTAAFRNLSLSWTERTMSFERVSGDLDAILPPPSAESLVQHIAGNPGVARWAVEISARVAERRLARAEAIPDLVGRFGIRRHQESGNDALVVGLSLPLPLFDRGQAQIQSARAGEAAAQDRQLAAELQLEGLLNDTYAALANAYDEAFVLRDRALPAAEQAYRDTQLAFEEGKLRFLDVLDAQRTLFELQTRHLQALENYHLVAAAAESLIGRSLVGLHQ